ncbi:bacterial transcriptional activator domain-containing protein [Pseudonocardia sp. NPDC049635]|uniref:AfsR/SARP family transcriptional regulator n=1 Tax=Pseudonocardia sp. NPDC049635 TaxID=3155506 RepID=UPI0033CA18A2
MRIQLHGQFMVVVDGRVVQGRLPGRRARMLVAYLADRPRPIERTALMEVLWEPGPPGPGGPRVFDALLSKTRAVLRPVEIRGRDAVNLVVPPGGLVDATTAAMALHEAEAAAGVRDWRRAWAHALSAVFVTQREFLPGFTGEWVARRRDEARLAHTAATACYAEACLELGGSELASAERCARRLLADDPLGERGYRLLMRAVAGRGDRAAALAVYQQLRRTLRDELGVSPDRRSTELNRALLAGEV